MNEKNFRDIENQFNQNFYKKPDEITGYFNERYELVEKKFNNNEIPGHLQGLPLEKAFLKIISPSSVEAIFEIGLYNSQLKKNPQVLIDAMFTRTRLIYQRKQLLDSGYDHCSYFLTTVECLAANDVDLTEEIFSQGRGLCSKGNKFLVTASNLVISLIHNMLQWKQQSLENASSFLKQKNSKSDQAVIQYLVALNNHDIDSANKSLLEIAGLYRKIKWLHDFKSPFLKYFSVFIHGLFNTAHFYLPEELFNEIKTPPEDFIWQELFDYNNKNNYPLGKSIIQFTGRLDFLNNYLK